MKIDEVSYFSAGNPKISLMYCTGLHFSLVGGVATAGYSNLLALACLSTAGTA